MSVTIRTRDGEEMTVNERVIVSYVVNKCKKCNTDDNVYVCVFEKETLLKTIKYLKFHARNDISPSDVEAFDNEFLNEEAAVISKIFVAADFLLIKGLKDLTRAIAKSYAADYLAQYANKETKGEVLSSRKKTKVKRSRETTEETPSSRKKTKGKRSRINSPTNTRFECVDGIDCIVREDGDIVEYIPYNGVYMKFCNCVAAAGEIPKEMKEEVKRRYRCAVTFSFPSVGMKIRKNARGKPIKLESLLESDKQANKYFDEAFQKAVDSLSLEDLISSSSSSVLRPCANGTSSSQPMIGPFESPNLGSSSSALRLYASGTSSSQPMIEVCMDPYIVTKPNIYVLISNKIMDVVESRYPVMRREGRSMW